MQVRQEQYNNISLPQVAGPCPGRGARGQGGQVHPTLSKNEVFNVELAPLSLLNTLYGIFFSRKIVIILYSVCGVRNNCSIKLFPQTNQTKPFIKIFVLSSDLLCSFAYADKHTGTFFYMLHCVMQVCSLYAQIFRYDQVFVQNFRFNEVYAQNYRFDDVYHMLKTLYLMRCTHSHKT